MMDITLPNAPGRVPTGKGGEEAYEGGVSTAVREPPAESSAGRARSHSPEEKARRSTLPSRTLQGYQPALDGIRGAAVIMVMVQHFVAIPGPISTAIPDRIFYLVAASGWTGVDLFFVLSGFLITGILYDSKASDDRYFLNFYTRRVLRIFPLYYFALLLLLHVLPATAPAYFPRTGAPDAPVYFWAYLQNSLIASEGWRAGAVNINHFWSLAVEEQFYLVWPFLVFFLPRRGLIAACAGLMVLSVALRLVLVPADQSLAAYVLAPARMDGLALGAMIALLGRSPLWVRRLRRCAPPVAAVSLTVLAAIFIQQPGLDAYIPLTQQLGYVTLVALFGAVVVMTLTGSPGGFLSRTFTSGVLRFFGKYSYSLYIFHPAILTAMLAAGFSAAAMPAIIGLRFPAQLLFITVGIALSTAVALATWHLFEKRFLALKDVLAPSPGHSSGMPRPTHRRATHA